MMSKRGENNVSAATKNDESHRYAMVVGGVVYIAVQENTVIRPEPILSPDHSSKKIELTDDDQLDLKLGTKLSLAPPSSFCYDQDLELGTKLSLAPSSSFRSPSPGFIHSPPPSPPPPPQLQQPPVPCNNKPYGFFDVLERISLLERLSNVCSNPSTSYGEIDEKGTHENATNDDQREEPESDDKELDLTLRL